MNGRVREVNDAGFVVDVVQSFGNCPKYIHVREHQRLARPRAITSQAETAALSPEAWALIEGADTFFIATTSGQHTEGWSQGTDVSHRGGEPGFVQLLDTEKGTRLLVPDYSGNGFFNTLGNLALDPRAGLLFVDFEHGHLLQLAARGRLIWNDAETAVASGADRALVLEVEGGQWLRDALDLRWS
jgi:predicted pyridoxine 5'-phosphate oxidase superfamily flavin-nucleotide-binding protein